MILEQELKLLGLTKTEAAVYLFLLENGVSSPSRIAKGAGILRTNCYHILQSLEAQGLIRPQLTGKRQSYLARDPESLYQSIEAKRETVGRILPDLRGLYTTQKHKPKVQFYEGLDQITEAYWRSLEAKEIFAIGSTHTLSNVLPDLYGKYIQEVKKRGIVFHDLLTHASKQKAGPVMQDVLKGLYDMRYVPEQYGDIPTDLLMWNDSIAHITLEEPFFATVITSPLIAKTMKTLFLIIREGMV